MSKLKKRLLIAVTLFCSFFALVACSENKIAKQINADRVLSYVDFQRIPLPLLVK